MNPIRWFTGMEGADGERGFSLVELLVAMLVLAIGILATMAMQFSALAGYTSAREVTGASEVARTVEHLIRAEARGWDSSMAWGTNVPRAYDDDHGDIFNAVTSAGGNWVSLFDEPVTQRLNEGGTDDGARRFCVYVAGEEVNEGGDRMTSGYGKIVIAVVYPGANGSFDGVDSDAPAGDCPGTSTDLNPSNRDELAIKGLRVTHLTTAVRAMNPPDNI